MSDILLRVRRRARSHLEAALMKEDKYKLTIRQTLPCDEIAALRAEIHRLRRQRHELKRQIACRDRRAAGMETCEGCERWLRPEEQLTDVEGVILCRDCYSEAPLATSEEP